MQTIISPNVHYKNPQKKIPKLSPVLVCIQYTPFFPAYFWLWDVYFLPVGGDWFLPWMKSVKRAKFNSGHDESPNMEYSRSQACVRFPSSLSLFDCSQGMCLCADDDDGPLARARWENGKNLKFVCNQIGGEGGNRRRPPTWHVPYRCHGLPGTLP